MSKSLKCSEMNYKYFNRDKVLIALEYDGYYIHTNTSQEARKEASRLCNDLSEHFTNLKGFFEDDDDNDVNIINIEVPPSCNFGVIRRYDMFSFIRLKEDLDKEALILEIENTRI